MEQKFRDGDFVTVVRGGLSHTRHALIPWNLI